MANLKSIVDELKQGRSRISRAIDALESVNGTRKWSSRGRKSKRRRMSAEARAKHCCGSARAMGEAEERSEGSVGVKPYTAKDDSAGDTCSA